MAERRIGEWIIEKELGRGGMGVVFRGRGPDGAPVAIKVLEQPSEKARKRLDTELRTLARLEHPNLVHVRAAGEHQGRPYIVMEFIAGRALSQVLDDDGPIEPRRAASIARTLALALEHCHRHGVLHRDLKPSNVLIDPRGEPRLVDFGLALDVDSALTRLTREGGALGTPGFWPPEQARGDLASIDSRSDVYSLGATLYAMLTGEPPFAGQDLVEVVARTESQHPTPPSAHVREVDGDLDRIVLECLSKNPAKRPQSAFALARELEGWLMGRRRAPRARPWRVIALLMVLFAALGAQVFEMVSRSRLREFEAAMADAHGAEDPLRRLIALDRALARVDDTGARLQRAEVLAQLTRTEEAREEVDRVLARDPSMAAAWHLSATLRPKPDGPEALADLERALSLDPDHAPSLALRASLRELAKDTTGALADLTRLITRWPHQAEWWSSRALVRDRLSDPKGALEDIEQAIRIAPQEPSYLVTRGVLREKLDDQAGAIEDFMTATRRAPQATGQGVARLSEMLNRIGQTALLETLMTNLLAEVETGERYRTRASARTRLNKHEGARDDLLRAVELEPSHVLGWANLGTAQHKLGNFREAEAAMTRSIELDPSWADLHRNRAGVRIELDDYEGAMEDLDVLLAKNPRDVRAILRKGVLLHRQDKFEEALRIYDEVIRLDPNEGQAYLDRAGTLEKLSRLPEACASLELAIQKLPPEHPLHSEALSQLRRLQAALGR